MSQPLSVLNPSDNEVNVKKNRSVSSLHAVDYILENDEIKTSGEQNNDEGSLRSSKDIHKNIEFFFFSDMSCPIDGCTRAPLDSFSPRQSTNDIGVKSTSPKLSLIPVWCSTVKNLAIGDTT